MQAVYLEQKISLALLLLGFIPLVVTLAMPNWFKGQGVGGHQVHVGLWKICGELGSDDCVSLDGSPSWITGPEALECACLSCALGAVALSFRMLFNRSKVVCCLTGVFAVLSGLMGLIGALVFNKKVALPEAAWCFYLNLAADSLFLASGIVMAMLFFRTARR